MRGCHAGICRQTPVASHPDRPDDHVGGIRDDAGHSRRPADGLARRRLRRGRRPVTSAGIRAGQTDRFAIPHLAGKAAAGRLGRIVRQWPPGAEGCIDPPTGDRRADRSCHAGGAGHRHSCRHHRGVAPEHLGRLHSHVHRVGGHFHPRFFSRHSAAAVILGCLQRAAAEFRLGVPAGYLSQSHLRGERMGKPETRDDARHSSRSGASGDSDATAASQLARDHPHGVRHHGTGQRSGGEAGHPQACLEERPHPHCNDNGPASRLHDWRCDCRRDPVFHSWSRHVRYQRYRSARLPTGAGFHPAGGGVFCGGQCAG